MTKYEVKIESDEDGFRLIVGSDIDPDRYTFPLEDAEALYDTVKAEIGPWLYERDMAKAKYESGARNIPDERDGYALDDPKHSGFHERMSAAADDREKV